MDGYVYKVMHDSADRLALEAARRAPADGEAKYYIEAYTKVLDFLVDKYNKSDHEKKTFGLKDAD